jgi:hypothetical protein
MRVRDIWPSATRDEVFYIINYFSDIVVNNELYSNIVGQQFFDALKIYVERTTTETLVRGHRISNQYLIFVLVHELLWNRRFSVFEYPDVIKHIASKIVSALIVSSWYDSIAVIASMLKTTIITDDNKGNPGHGIDVLTKEMCSRVRASMEVNNANNAKKDGTNPGKSVGARGKDVAPNAAVIVKKNGKLSSKPFDMTIFMGDTTSEKTRATINSRERENDERNVYDTIVTTGMLYPVAAFMLKHLGIAKYDDDAWRLWLRARARGLMQYDTSKQKRETASHEMPSQWEWGDPLREMNVFQSFMACPVYPFPPYAAGIKHRPGGDGSSTLPDVRDILIVRDSSGSMGGLMEEDEKSDWGMSSRARGYENTKFNISSLATFAALHAAVARGANVAVINFSGNFSSTGWMRPSKASVTAAENAILQFTSGTTFLPVKKMMDVLEEKRHCFVLTITDSFIYNWNEFYGFARYLSEREHVA